MRPSAVRRAKHKPESIELHTPNIQAAGDAGAMRSHAGLRVLIADDNPVNQVVVEAMLAQLGVICVIASNGQEAIERAVHESFALVLMDMHMPELDGLAATQALRRQELDLGRSRVPVVAMTANSESDDGPACVQAGMDGFLSKPFGLAELRRCLARHAPDSTTPPDR